MNESSLEANDEPLIKKSEDSSDNSDKKSDLNKNKVIENEQNNIDTRENNNQVDNNNPDQQNNNGLRPVILHMLARFGQNNRNVDTVGNIKTNNSIAIWYALETTMSYLRRRQIGVVNENRSIIEKLDPLVKQNLQSISSYLNTLGIEIEDIDALANAFGNIENQRVNGNQVQICSNVDENKISDIVNKHKDSKQSIEDLVFNDLIKQETDKSVKLIENANEDKILLVKNEEKEKILLVKNDFDVLKRNIQENDDNQENGDDDIIVGTSPRDKKVFLSRAAKEFQDQVSKLEQVKKSNEQDDKRKNYNEAVKNLDEAIKLAIKQKIAKLRNSSKNGYMKSQVTKILHTLKLKNDEKNDENNIQQPNNEGIQPKQNVGDANRVKDLTSLANEDNVIQGKSEEKLLSELSERIKEHLSNMDADGVKKQYIKEVLEQDEKGDVWTILQSCLKQRDKLEQADQKKIKHDGAKIENDNKDNKKDDGLINISNDKDIGKITLEYDEYNDLVAKTLFNNPDDVESTMSKLLKNLLLQDPKSDECQKAKGNLKGMMSQVNKQLTQVKNNGKYKQYKGKYLQAILPLDKKMGLRDVDVKQQKFFVPTFINQLFEINSGDKLENLASNLETLVQDQNFKTFLSNIMKDDFAVDMIKNNFEQIEKDFKDAGYKVTRRGKFKEEFWDNNLKGHLPFVGKWSNGRWKKNLVMLGSESLGGFALGSIFAAKLGLSLAGGILPAIGAAAVILVTAIAIAVLVSLIMTLVKGFRDLKNSAGFYEPSKQDRSLSQNSQTAYLNRIYSAFLTFGADEGKLKELVADSKKPEFNKKSPKGKFFKSMEDMKNFLKEHAKDNLKTALEHSSPFKILEEREQPPLHKVGNKENNNGKDQNNEGQINNNEQTIF